jgi:ribosome biogenesis GTPase
VREAVLRGFVVRGSWNIFTVRIPGGSGDIECRFKGKVLKGVDGYANPLAPGDWVQVEPDSLHPGFGLILALEERKSLLTRYNPKGLSSSRVPIPQILAANVDLVLCVTTPASPPFRPRFLDRALIQADTAGIPALVICNKWDLFREDPDVEERLEDYSRIGVQVLRLSAKTGEGMGEFRSLIGGRFSVLIGQSGVGKSSLINALLPDPRIRVGLLNEKYDRGSHTTTLSEAFEIPGAPADEGRGTFLIDTPGMRLFVPHGLREDDVILHMGEFAPLAGTCAYGHSCSHRTEPGCKVLEAVAAGMIHEDRYESFLRIRDEIGGNRYDE